MNAQGEIIEMAYSLPSSWAYRQAVMSWLARTLGYDTFFFSTPLHVNDMPVCVAGQSEVQLYYERFPAYEGFLRRVFMIAQGEGGVAQDLDHLSVSERSREPIYCELLRAMQTKASAVTLLSMPGRPPSYVYLGRGGCNAQFTQRELDFVRSIRSAIAVGDALHTGPLHGAATPLYSAAPTVSAMVTERISRREQEIVRHVANGLTNVQIAVVLGTSPNTVRNQLAVLFRKFRVSSRSELISMVNNSLEKVTFAEK
jgi:DNA-binding CsgD family transcriptional regulator